MPPSNLSNPPNQLIQEKLFEHLQHLVSSGIPINIVGQRQDTFPLIKKILTSLQRGTSLRENFIFIDGTYKYPFNRNKKPNLTSLKPEVLNNKAQAKRLVTVSKYYKLLILDPTKEQLPTVDHLLGNQKILVWTQRTEGFYTPMDKDFVCIIAKNGKYELLEYNSN